MDQFTLGKKVGLIGHLMYSQETEAVNGQAAKTRNFYQMLCARYGKDNIMTLDTNYFRKHLFKNYIQLIQICRQCETILILPTGNGLKLILPVLGFLKKVYHYKILYPVVGGWLPKLIKESSFVRQGLHCVDRIYPETEGMSTEIRNLGFSQIETMYNFSMRNETSEGVSNTPKNQQELPYKLCTFSRVTKTKGIREAVFAVSEINHKAGKRVCTLNIYGPVDQGYKQKFEELLTENASCVAYSGVLSGAEVIPTLSKYLLMLFPTYYPGEGMPGAVLEAFTAGVPVIASNWHSNAEVITHQKTGMIYELNQKGKLVDTIESLLADLSLIDQMKTNCLQESKKYTPEKVIEPVYQMIES